MSSKHHQTLPETDKHAIYLRMIINDMIDRLRVTPDDLLNMSKAYQQRIDPTASSKDVLSRARNTINGLNRLVITWKSFYDIFHLFSAIKIDFRIKITRVGGSVEEFNYHIDNTLACGYAKQPVVDPTITDV